MSNIQGNNGGRFYSSLVKPILIDCNFVVDPTNVNGLGVSSLKGANVRNVFMHTSATPGRGAQNYLNPNPAVGYALVQLKNNYSRYIGSFKGFIAPATGSAKAINASALTIGAPYTIVTVGAGAAGAATIAPVADSAGSLASTWFKLFDAYGNTFIIWFSVSGVGSAPVGVSGTLVQQSILANATAAQIGAALVLTIQNLPSGVSGVSSFTAAGTTTVTVTSTKAVPLAGAPADGVIPTGFTFAQTVFATNLRDWQGVGVPLGVVPAVGVSFIATAVGYSTGGGSSGTVISPGVTGISSVEVIGDPTQSLSPIPMGGSGHAGGWIMVQFVGATAAGDTTNIAVAPTALSVCSLSFYLEASSVTIAGE